MKKTRQFLKEQTNKNDILVVGVSGGPDSMALLSLLCNLKKEMPIQIICAHINHNIRKESEAEELFVADFCKRNGIIFEAMKIQTYSTDNFHNEARIKRYQFFEQLIKKYNAKYLLTAHHADDLMETILMRIVRGSTLKGYSGFQECVKRDTYVILRPLIHATKEEIYEYLSKNGISYIEDQSNLKDGYTRNRFRKYIVPEIKKENSFAHEKFYKFSKTLSEYSDYIKRQTLQKYSEVMCDGCLNINEFIKLDFVLQREILYIVLENIYQKHLSLITDRHIDCIFELLFSVKGNAEICLPNQIRVIKTYQNLQFVSSPSEKINYHLELKKSVILPNGRSIKIETEEELDNNFICRLNKEEVKFPLYVRNRIKGDKIAIKGLNGHKKIKDIFINEKISQEEREIWPIVIDSNNEVVWLPGLKKSKFDKTKEEKYDIILKYD